VIRSLTEVHVASAPVRRTGKADRDARAPAPERGLDFAALYDEWFDEVFRWLRALGAPAADREDLAQEVFLVVRRRLADFDGRNVAGWLYQIARRQVLRHKRLRWVQRAFGWSAIESVGDSVDAKALLQAATTPSPLAALEAKERRALFEALVAGLSEKRRAVLVLFELEGYTGEEIAEILDVPLNTVWTRLHHARRDFLTALARFRGNEEEGGRSR
jgi:RNA polymerase sigma-70 factor, ECF subfamily